MVMHYLGQCRILDCAELDWSVDGVDGPDGLVNWTCWMIPPTKLSELKLKAKATISVCPTALRHGKSWCRDRLGFQTAQRYQGFGFGPRVSIGPAGQTYTQTRYSKFEGKGSVVCLPCGAAVWMTLVRR